MKLILDTIVLFIQNVDKLRHFYIQFFGLELVEEIKSEWVLLDAGNCRIGLHKTGSAYVMPEDEFKAESNTKMVFQVDEDIFQLRERLINNHVTLKEIKTFDNYDYWLCDGEDPEENVFQLKQKKV